MHVEHQAERKCGRKRDKLFDMVFTEAPTMRGARSLGPDVWSVVQLGFSKMWSTFWSSFLRSGKECCSQLQC